MSTVASPYGFRPVKGINGTDPQTNVYAPLGYSIASGYGSDIFTGDPVSFTGTADAKGRPGLKLATLSDNPVNIVGIFAGVEYVDVNFQKPFFSQKWSASTAPIGEIQAWVYDHEDTIFAIQGNATCAATDVFNDADFATGTGNSLTYQSAYTIDTSSIGTGTALQIIGLDPQGTVAFDTYPDVLVLIREHQKRGNAAGGWPVVG